MARSVVMRRVAAEDGLYRAAHPVFFSESLMEPAPVAVGCPYSELKDDPLYRDLVWTELLAELYAERAPVSHTIDSMNYFYENGISEVFNEKRTITIRHKNAAGRSLLFVFTMCDEALSRPCITGPSGRLMAATATMAMDRKTALISKLTFTMRAEKFDITDDPESEPIEVRLFADIPWHDIPVLVGSELAPTMDDATVPSAMDALHAFFVGTSGTPMAHLGRLVHKYNKPACRLARGEAGLLECFCEYRSEHMVDSKSTSTLQIAFRVAPGEFAQCMVHLQYAKDGAVPASCLFNLLGLSDETALELLIACSGDNEEVVQLVREIAAMPYPPREELQEPHRLIGEQLFPSMGTTSAAAFLKAMELADTICKMAHVIVGTIPPDRLSSLLGRQINTAGMMCQTLFRLVHWDVLLSIISKLRDRVIESDGEEYNVFDAITAAGIPSGQELIKAVTTGVWSPSGGNVGRSVQHGVTEPISFQNPFSRLIAAQIKVGGNQNQGPNVSTRLLKPEDIGMICPFRHPEGANTCGLVLELAIGAVVRTAIPLAPFLNVVTAVIGLRPTYSLEEHARIAARRELVLVLVNDHIAGFVPDRAEAVARLRTARAKRVFPRLTSIYSDPMGRLHVNHAPGVVLRPVLTTWGYCNLRRLRAECQGPLLPFLENCGAIEWLDNNEQLECRVAENGAALIDDYRAFTGRAAVRAAQFAADDHALERVVEREEFAGKDALERLRAQVARPAAGRAPADDDVEDVEEAVHPARHWFHENLHHAHAASRQLDAETIDDLTKAHLKEDPLTRESELVPTTETLTVDEETGIVAHHAEDDGLVASRHVADLRRFREPIPWTPYTHVTIHPVFTLGATAAAIPFPNMTAGARAAYATSQSNSAAGAQDPRGTQKYQGTTISQVHSNKALVRTAASEIMGIHTECGIGQPAVMAIGAFAAGIEDGLIMNQASLERGLFQQLIYKTFVVSEECSGTDRPEICIPPPGTQRMYDADYSKLDGTGVVHAGSKVVEGDILIGRVVRSKVAQDDGTRKDVFTDNSIMLRGIADGVVDSVFSTEGAGGGRIVRVVVRRLHIPVLGDKFSTREGQKGVICKIMRPEDMPWTPSPVLSGPPDIIFNMHGIASRMTINMLAELLLGVYAALVGKPQDASPIGELYSMEREALDLDKVYELLRQRGMDSMGKLPFHSGVNGMPIGDMFCGIVQSLPLVHQSESKMHARGKQGPRSIITGQPPSGKSRDGGHRVGEMEGDAFAGHGALSVLLDRRVEQSDAKPTAYCSRCGFLARRNVHGPRNLYAAADGSSIGMSDKWCDNCRTGAHVVVDMIPQSFVVLMQSFEAAGISARFLAEKRTTGPRQVPVEERLRQWQRIEEAHEEEVDEALLTSATSMSFIGRPKLHTLADQLLAAPDRAVRRVRVDDDDDVEE